MSASASMSWGALHVLGGRRSRGRGRRSASERGSLVPAQCLMCEHAHVPPSGKRCAAHLDAGERRGWTGERVNWTVGCHSHMWCQLASWALRSAARRACDARACGAQCESVSERISERVVIVL